MKDLIERQAAIDAFEDTTFTRNEVRRRLSELPSAQPERKVGRWITESLEDDFTVFYSLKCSECGKYYGWEHNYCPNCGADMKVKNECTT